jgi:hypothetical protein
MKLHKISALWMSLLLVLGTMVFSACSNDDLNTDQYGNDICLNSFGPCPVLRGGVLTFLGSNLDQITEIDLPGADAITSINIVKKGKESEINIEVPKEKCTEGIITLKTAKGGAIQTLTPITYEENVTFTEFYVGQTGNLTGNVGDVVTIKGDYLNLVSAVIFADGISVSDSSFLSKTRYQITVAIPKQAKTGRLQLHVGDNYLYSDKTLTVNLPTATGVSPTTVKAGKTVTVTGTDLNQIATIELQGATIDTMAITRATDGKSLTFTLPEKATDGEVTLVTYSGVKISAGSITTVVPSELSTEPSPVKNGATLTIKGKDLDLVKTLSFPNAGETSIASKSETEIKVTVPETAQTGDITLSLANGKSVTVAYKLVEATITAFVPTSLMAGNQVIIRGTDLDLVASITFPTNQIVEAKDFVKATSGAIAVVVPSGASGSGVVLTMKNGTTLTASGLTVEPSTNPTLTNAPSGTPGSEVTLEGKNYNNVETVYFGSTKVTKFVSRTSTSMTVVIPDAIAAGTYDVIMNTSDGKSFTVGKVTVVPKEIDISASGNILTEDRAGVQTFPMNLGSWDKKFRIMRDSPVDLTKYTWTADKSVMKIYKTKTETGQAQINDPGWGALTYAADWSGTEDVIEVTLTQAMIDCITGAKSDGWSSTAFIIQGQGYTITKITLVP